MSGIGRDASEKSQTRKTAAKHDQGQTVRTAFDSRFGTPVKVHLFVSIDDVLWQRPFVAFVPLSKPAVVAFSHLQHSAEFVVVTLDPRALRVHTSSTRPVSSRVASRIAADAGNPSERAHTHLQQCLSERAEFRRETALRRSPTPTGSRRRRDAPRHNPRHHGCASGHGRGGRSWNRKM